MKLAARVLAAAGIEPGVTEPWDCGSGRSPRPTTGSCWRAPAGRALVAAGHLDVRAGFASWDTGAVVYLERLHAGGYPPHRMGAEQRLSAAADRGLDAPL